MACLRRGGSVLALGWNLRLALFALLWGGSVEEHTMVKRFLVALLLLGGMLGAVNAVSVQSAAACEYHGS